MKKEIQDDMKTIMDHIDLTFPTFTSLLTELQTHKNKQDDVFDKTCKRITVLETTVIRLERELKKAINHE